MKYSVGTKGKVIRKCEGLPDSILDGSRFTIVYHGTPRRMDMECYGIQFENWDKGHQINDEIGDQDGWYLTESQLDSMIASKSVRVGSDPEETKLKLPGMGI